MRNSGKVIFVENFKTAMAFYSTQLFPLEGNAAEGALGPVRCSAEAAGRRPPPAAGPRAQGLQLQAWGAGERSARGRPGQSPRASLRPVGKAPAGCTPKSSDTPKTGGKRFSRGCLEQAVTALKLGHLKR